MRVLITGATGFVGKAVTEAACLAGHDVTALVRNLSDALPEQVSQIAVGDFANLDQLNGRSLDSRLHGNDDNINGSNDQLTNIGKRSVIPENADLRDYKSVIASKAKQSEVEDQTAAAGHAETKNNEGLEVTGVDRRISVKSSADNFLSALQNIDIVIHTAARAHVMKEEHDDPAAVYHSMNVTLTEKLALAAADAGVKRFVFISSIKVNGELTAPYSPIPTFPLEGGRSNSSSPSPSGGEGWGEGGGKPFTESDTPNPQDHYGISKWQAEQKLMEIGQNTGMETVILRPPLVYGPGVKGNFASLIKWVNKGIPLPFGAIHNRRSLLALDNLVSAILLVSEHPAAANQTFLLADDEDVSTTELIKLIAQLQGKKARLIPVPVSWMTFAARLIGKKPVADRLFGSLQIDASKIRQTLGWKPVITMPRQLAKIQFKL